MNISKTVIYILIALLLGLLFYLFCGDYGLWTYVKLNNELEQINTENQELSRANQELSEQIKMLTEDVRAIEQAIRQELGYVKDGEIVVFFEDDDDQRDERTPADDSGTDP
ncbi:MAG: septum formation initiator family protein [Candidatus Alcyoniella australis]|nr:septum formation initiator family protein [Candidatus Alcyoniella australis]